MCKICLIVQIQMPRCSTYITDWKHAVSLSPFLSLFLCLCMYFWMYHAHTHMHWHKNIRFNPACKISQVSQSFSMHWIFCLCFASCYNSSHRVVWLAFYVTLAVFSERNQFSCPFHFFIKKKKKKGIGTADQSKSDHYAAYLPLLPVKQAFVKSSQSSSFLAMSVEAPSNQTQQDTRQQRMTVLCCNLANSGHYSGRSPANLNSYVWDCSGVLCTVRYFERVVWLSCVVICYTAMPLREV